MKTHFHSHVRRAGRVRASKMPRRLTLTLCIPVNH